MRKLAVSGKTIKQVRDSINYLKKKTGIRTVRLAINSADSRCSFYAEDLIGDLSNKSIIYFPGQEILLGKKVTEYLPEKLTLGMKKSLARKLRAVLPKKSFEFVYDYISKNY